MLSTTPAVIVAVVLLEWWQILLVLIVWLALAAGAVIGLHKRRVELKRFASVLSNRLLFLGALVLEVLITKAIIDLSRGRLGEGTVPKAALLGMVVGLAGLLLSEWVSGSEEDRTLLR
jgi:hypothetical protein